MNIRLLALKLSDKLRGGHVMQFCGEIERYLYSDKPQENTSQLEKLLRHASANIPFYKRLSPGIDISAYPVIDKMTIKEHEDEFIWDKYDKSQLFKETTSGSTGTPLVVYQDPLKRQRAMADTLTFSKFAGFNFGSRLYYSRVWNDLNRISRIGCMLRNVVMQDSDRLTDDDMRRFLTILEKDKSEKSVLIFASTLAALDRYMEANEVTTSAKVSSFITMSESLPKVAREGIRKKFNTNVVSRYSNCECGIIAQQCCDCDEYHINTGSFFVEILQLDNDLPVQDGSAGRIVVTDLYNFAMPLIRYDTGDIGRMAIKSECGMGAKVLTLVEGRRVDCIFSSSGKALSPYVINNTMWQFREIAQYQFIQKGANSYELRVVMMEGRNAHTERWLESLRFYLGEDADIEVIIVDNIPLLASGKRKQVVNNYKYL